ncbi:oligosaccharide flippase family protein [Candidatus Sumerlaeota bacterium]|nr:oligosaccharide flippase family protein [Candidatus Sumerlaeota bacterium]
MASLLSRTLAGLGKTASLTVAKTLVDAATLYAIIWVLELPELTGDLFWILVWVEIFHFLSNLGGQRYLVQRPELSDSDVATVTTTELGAALLWASVWLFASPTLLRAVGWGHLGNTAQVMTLWLITERLGQPARALLERDLRFGRSNGSLFIGTLVMSAVAVSLAIAGWGVQSFLIGRVCQSATSAVLLWTFAGRPPRLGWSREAARPYLRFGLPIFFAELMQLYYKRIPELIIGTVLQSRAVLGVYSVAVRLPDYLRQIQDISGAVVYSAFSRARSEESLCEGFQLATKYSAAVGLLPLTLVLVLGAGVVDHLLPPGYGGITVALQIFTALAVFRIITNHWFFAYLSKGRTGAIPFLALLNATGVTIGAAIGIRWGITGVAIGVTVPNALVILLAIEVFLKRVLPVRYLPAVALPLTVAAVTLLAGLALGPLGLDQHVAWQFWTAVALLTTLYVALGLALDARALLAMWRRARS